MGNGVYGRLYAEPRADLDARIEERRGIVERYEAASALAARRRRSVASYEERTLGGDRQTVDHRLRSRLNRIAEETEARHEGARVSVVHRLGKEAWVSVSSMR